MKTKSLLLSSVATLVLGTFGMAAISERPSYASAKLGAVDAKVQGASRKIGTSATNESGTQFGDKIAAYRDNTSCVRLPLSQPLLKLDNSPFSHRELFAK